MGSSRKRKLEISSDVGEQNDGVLHKLKKYKEVIVNDSDEKSKKKAIRHFARLLADSKDDENFKRCLIEAIDQEVVGNLLVAYNATESEWDKNIFDLLRHLERTYGINFGRMAPVVWGKRSRANYENLRRLGQTLHTRLTSDQVLDFLDGRKMWHSLLKFNDSPSASRKTRPEEVYDARFVLRLLISLLAPGAEVSCRKFIDVNALSFAFAATSLHHPSNRALAYVVLQRFLARLSDLTTESFSERPLYSYTLKVFRNSIEVVNQRIPHVVSHFFARICKLFLHPEDPVFSPILSFLVLKPTVDLNNVPEFYKLLMSSSTEHNKEERQWILRLIAESMIEPNDYNILQKKFGVKYCLVLFTSCISDFTSRKYILFILSSALEHPSVARDLFCRHNLQAWIVLTIQQSWLGRWEVCFLCQLFVQLMEHVEALFSKQEEGSEKEGALNSVDESTRKVCRMLGKKVLEVLDKVNDQGRALWFERLKALVDVGTRKVEEVHPA